MGNCATAQDTRLVDNPEEETSPNYRTVLYEKWRQLDVKEKMFIVIAVVTTLVMLGFSSNRIQVLNNSHQPFTSEIVMLVSEGFCLYYICRGISVKRSYEIIIYLAVIAGDVIYCTYDFTAIESPTVFAKTRLALDWILGFALPLIFGICIVKQYKFPANGDEENPNLCDLTLFHSVTVLDFQLTICNVIFILADKQIQVQEIVPIVVGGIIYFIFFVIQKMDKRRKHLLGIFFFISLGTFPFLFIVDKIVKQYDAIRNGVFLDMASLLFGLLSGIIRFGILYLCYRILRKYVDRLKNESPQTQGQQNEVVEMGNRGQTNTTYGSSSGAQDPQTQGEQNEGVHTGVHDRTKKAYGSISGAQGNNSM